MTSRRSSKSKRIVGVALAIAAVFAVVHAWRDRAGCFGASGPSRPERVARAIAERSPLADPASVAARDEASAALGTCGELLGAMGRKILWGGYDPAKGVDPDAYLLTEFDPLVWAKVYLSTFMFTGAVAVRDEGRFRVAEIDARFRGGLDAGEYPYPFWHSPKKWDGYVGARSVLLVFDGDELVAAYRKAETGASAPARAFDGRWTWTDAKGDAQPRVALFAYLFRSDNPHVRALEEAYRALESRFRENSCTSCHAPDNKAGMDELLLLSFPNQALAARHSLLATLRGNRMPPADPESGAPAGLDSPAQRDAMIRLAQAFESAADAAIAFERSGVGG